MGAQQGRPQPQIAVEHAVNSPPQLQLVLTMQAPALQVPVPQSLPQVPQLSGSLRVSTHRSPHSVSPEGQMHSPSTQATPAGQDVPQAPQLRGSMARSE